jgi:hypothetical protein
LDSALKVKFLHKCGLQVERSPGHGCHSLRPLLTLLSFSPSPVGFLVSATLCAGSFPDCGLHSRGKKSSFISLLALCSFSSVRGLSLELGNL